MVTLSITSLGMDPNLGPLRSDTQTASPLLIDAFVTGLRRTFLVSAGIVGVAAILSMSRGGRSALQEQTTEEPVKSVAS